MNLDGKGKAANRKRVARAVQTTTVGTAAGNINDLSMSVKAGRTYVFRAWISNVVTGTTNLNFGVTGPTVSAVRYTVKRGTLTAFSRSDVYSAFTDAAAGTAIVTTWAEIEGSFVATADGTLQLRAIRANDGTSMVIQIGSYMVVEEV